MRKRTISTIGFDGVAFATTEGPGNKGKGKNKKVKCYKCKKQGHYANKCDEDMNDENAIMT